MCCQFLLLRLPVSLKHAKQVTLNVATLTDTTLPNYGQFAAAPSPLRSYLLVRQKKRAAKSSQHSTTASDTVEGEFFTTPGNDATPWSPRIQTAAETTNLTKERDSNPPVSLSELQSQKNHVCFREAELQKVRQLKEASKVVPHRVARPLYMNGQCAHVHQQQMDTLAGAVWTPNPDLYYGKGIKAGKIRSKPVTGLGKSARATNGTETATAD